MEQEDCLDDEIINILSKECIQMDLGDSSAILDIIKTKNCWMRMRGGSKLRNFIDPSLSSLNTMGVLVISGSGPAITKVTCSL